MHNLALTTPSSGIPYLIEISGLKAKASTSAASGYFSATLFGHGNAVDGGTVDPISQNSYPSALGAQPYSESTNVGTVGSSCICYLPPPTDYGPASSVTLSLSYAPAGHDFGKPGSVFIVAILFPGAAVYCFGSATGYTNAAQWHLYTGAASSCVPYYSGALGQISNAPILQNADLRGLSGSKLYVGSGFGGALSPAGTAFNSMISNGIYSPVYVVP